MKAKIREILDNWFDKHASKEPDDTHTLVLHETYGWGDKAQPELEAEILKLVEEREQKARISELGGLLEFEYGSEGALRNSIAGRLERLELKGEDK